MENIVTVVNSDDFIYSCQKEGKSAQDCFQAWVNMFNRQFHKITTYLIYNEDFADNICIRTNDDGKGTSFTFDYNDFLYKIQTILNVPNINLVNQKVIEKNIDERIKLLKSIKTEEKLQLEFPALYETYNAGKLMWADMKSRKASDPTYTFEQYHMDEKYYFACGLRYVLPLFIEEQVKNFSKIKSNLPKIENLFENFSLNQFIYDNFSAKPTNLYIHDKVLDRLNAKEDELTAIRESYVENYIGRDKDEDVSYEDMDGYIISYEDFMRRYNALIRFKKIQLDWELLPAGLQVKFNNTPRKTKKSLTTDLTPYIELNKKKISFYGGLKIIKIARGTSINKGYYAMFLPNNEILLDKYSINGEPYISCYGNGIYNFDTDNFEELSPLTKQEIRQGHLCPFFTHQGAWEQKVTDQVVSKPVTEETLNKTNELVRKLGKTK